MTAGSGKKAQLGRKNLFFRNGGIRLNVKRKPVRLLAVLIFTAMLLALLGGAARPKQLRNAAECYRDNEAALLYLRSYYPSGSLKATGSGFILTEDGLLITAAHVVSGGGRFTAVQKDESELELTLVQSDDETDIAVLRLPEGNYPTVTLAETVPHTGSVLRAMGFPIKGTAIITEGLLSAQCVEVSGKNRMMVTCDIVNGMSGGPILDGYGRVVGVVSGSVRTMDGIHLSVLGEELFQTAREVINRTENEE